MVDDSLSRDIFEKILYSISRMKKSINIYSKNVNTDCTDIGDKCTSYKEAEKIMNILQKILFQRLRFIISRPMYKYSSFSFVFYSLTCDGWSKS